MAFSQDERLKIQEAMLDQLLGSRDVTLMSTSSNFGDASYIEVVATIRLPKGSATVTMRFDIDDWNDIMKENK